MGQAFQPAAIMGSAIQDRLNKSNLQLVVGLGNPGKKYDWTRHNAGFLVADRIADEFDISFHKKKFNSVFGRGIIETVDVVLAKPMAYMNRSGLPVRQLADFYKIHGKDMLVIHDDIDLAFGRLKIKEKGGHGGHNGIKSLMNAFGGGEFTRLRIGVGRSETGTSVTDHVLGKFSAEQKQNLNEIISRAQDAVVTILCKGPKIGMNFFNSKNFIIRD